MLNFIKLGKAIYNTNNPREARRMVIFVIRAYIHYKQMRRLLAFFHQDKQHEKLLELNPYFYEQITRAFFYKDSNFTERTRLIEEHVDFLSSRLKQTIVEKLYDKQDVVLWQSEYEEKPLKFVLAFEPGQRKEGLLSVILRLDMCALYQIMFWIAKDKDMKWSMWIGAMQGPNIENSREIIKKLTKQCHAYRTKNMILYAAQAVTRSLGLERIYAVTNSGYYANNHLRKDRKLKTSFSDFWEEAGGKPSEDKRFYELPLIEHRKTMEEVPTRKRAVYRKRFVLLDELDTAIYNSIDSLKL